MQPALSSRSCVLQTSVCGLQSCEHTKLLTNNHKHGARRIRAPHNRQTCQQVAEETIQGYDYSQGRDEYKGQQTVAQNRCRSRVCQRRSQVRTMRVSMVLPCSRFSSVNWRRHEREELVEEYRAHECQSCSKSTTAPHIGLLVLTIDVTKVQLSRELGGISF
jgi:hypothetical protein